MIIAPKKGDFQIAEVPFCRDGNREKSEGERESLMRFDGTLNSVLTFKREV